MQQSDPSQITRERKEFSAALPARAISSTARSSLLFLLALLPFLGFLVGSTFVNQVTPLVFGFPRLLAWIVLWIILTSCIMSVIYILDPQNAPAPPDEKSRP
ncbi:MAG: DUF3311 domain-containing protein [Bradyrhizobiaceae bacterium]|nr:MAG: DUF3311 domain-containing protein [Bradyrhizobiaceae bacterium]